MYSYMMWLEYSRTKSCIHILCGWNILEQSHVFIYDVAWNILEQSHVFIYDVTWNILEQSHVFIYDVAGIF